MPVSDAGFVQKSALWKQSPGKSRKKRIPPNAFSACGAYPFARKKPDRFRSRSWPVWNRSWHPSGTVSYPHLDVYKRQANTGSLGQGVSLAAGLAAGLKLDGLDSRVYVAVGDGELAEGQLWEAFMAASNFQLDNLRVIIDRNGLQATGRTADRFRIGSIEDKMRAFGFEVLVIDGHDMQQIAEALDKADEVKEKPVCIIADTVKGKGIPFAEGVAGFHNGTLTQEQYEEALQDLRCVSRTEA